MYQECETKQASGPSFEKMKAALQRMEMLANEHSDFMAFQGQLMQENLMGDFGLYSGEVLAGMAKAEQADTYDDKALLEQSLNGLRDALKRLDDMEQDTRNEVLKHAKAGEEKLTEVDLIVAQKSVEQYEPIKKAIRELIAFGETCENLPTFLRIQMEKGMDKAMDGSVVVRDVFEEDVVLSDIQHLSPFHKQRSRDILNMYVALQEKSAFGTPEPIEVEMERRRIEVRYQPDLDKWDKVRYEWRTILETLAHWVASQCPRAPYVDPWQMIPEPAKSEQIKEDKHCNPGWLEGYLNVFRENHGLSFMDIFRLESFRYDVEDHRLLYSQEYMLHLIRNIFPQCRTGNFLSQELIDLDMKFYNEKRMWDPEPMPSMLKFIEWFNNKYGAGVYQQRFGPYEHTTTNAAPWNYQAFLAELGG
jgi:hypothetical protein